MYCHALNSICTTFEQYPKLDECDFRCSASAVADFSIASRMRFKKKLLPLPHLPSTPTASGGSVLFQLTIEASARAERVKPSRSSMAVAVERSFVYPAMVSPRRDVCRSMSC